MRIIACGDMHCKPHLLRKALEATKWDLFVFLGDACDNFGATQENNIEMINLLIELKKKYGDKFVWLLGNHDWGYYDDTISMSGHIYPGSAQVHYLLKENIDLWDLFYAKDKYIFSHAGIDARFLALTHDIPYRELKERTGYNNPVNNVGFACGGDSDVPSLIWARPVEIRELPLDNIQIVGHTPVDHITWQPNGLILCDTFSQYTNLDFFGDRALLLIEIEDGEHKLTAIDHETGKELYEVL